MNKYCNIQKFKNRYYHMIGTQFDNAIIEMENDRFCEDVITINEFRSVLDNIETEILTYIDDLDVVNAICDIFDNHISGK